MVKSSCALKGQRLACSFLSCGNVVFPLWQIRSLGIAARFFFFRRLSSSPSTEPAQTRKLTHTSQKKVHTRTPGPGLRSVPVSSPVSQNEILNWPTRWCEEKLSSVLLKYSFKQCAACQLWQQQPQTRCAAISYNLPGAHPYEIFGCMLKSTVMLIYKGLCSTDSSLYEQEFNPSVFHILDTWRRSFILRTEQRRKSS